MSENPSELPPDEIIGGLFDISRQWRKVLFGADAIDRLAGELEGLGIRRPLVVTTRSVAKDLELMDNVLVSLGRPPARIFADSRPHTPFPTVCQAAEAAEASSADGIITVGGGSCTDTGKAAAIVLACEIDSVAELRRYQLGSLDFADAPELPWRTDPLPLVALPTTLAGAEFMSSVGITDTDSRTKHIFMHRAAAPRAIVLDPHLTSATPDRLWASTGIKTFSDAFEQLTSRSTNPVIEALALGAIDLFAASLQVGFERERRSNVEGRLRCQVASWMTYFGTLSSGTSLGLGVALRHQLGAYFGVPHGEVTCVLLPHVLEFNLPATLELQPRLALALEIGSSSDHDCVNVGRSVIARVVEILRRLRLPMRLRDLGVPDSGFEEIAHRVMKEPTLATNPREIVDPSQVVEILRSAY